jgi:polar amino acid transport system substrate-binding protein
MPIVRQYLCSAIIATMLGALPAGATQRMTVAVVDRSLQLEAVSRAILTEAYRRIDIDLQFKEVPATRALFEASQGHVDGDLQRIDGLSARFPKLAQVKVPINEFDAVVVTRDKQFTPDGWSSLTPYTIGFHRGIVIFENRTAGMKTDPAPTNELVLKKLQTGRTDIAVMPEGDSRDLLATMPGHSLMILFPAVERVPLYHYVHTRHAALVPRLEAALRAMQADGSAAAIRARVLDRRKPPSAIGN